MKAPSRVGKILLGAALALAPAMTGAQEAPTTNSPAPETVGPRELRNFSLPGTVTRRAEEPASAAPQPQAQRSEAPPPAPVTRAPAAEAATRAAPPPAAPAPRDRPVARSSPTQPVQTSPAPLNLGPSPVSGVAASPQLQSADFPPAADPGLAASSGGDAFPLLAWLLAALALGAGGAFLFYRSRSRQALAGGPIVDDFRPPDLKPNRGPPAALKPAPAPPRTAAPPPPKPTAPKPTPQPSEPTGLVSTRLRPWVDIGFKPGRCILDGQNATIEFEVELFNSGSAPARAIIVDATAFNAGPAQDAHIDAFFANPRQDGDAVEMLAPLQRISRQLQLMIPRDQLQPYELGGKQVFVPLIAFNLLYRWSSGEGQTSASYLLGREADGEKLRPFTLQPGPRIFRRLSSRLLPAAVRR